MAQFSEVEQMANLNSSMRLTRANSLIGKQITVDKSVATGNIYGGQVQSIIKNGDDINLNVAVGKEKDSNGNLVDNIQEFSMDDITNIQDSNSTSGTTGTTSTNQTASNTSS